MPYKSQLLVFYKFRRGQGKLEKFIFLKRRINKKINVPRGTFYENKNSTFRKRNKIKSKPNYRQNKLISFMKFQRALHRIFSLERFFSNVFQAINKDFTFCKYAKLDKIFFVQKKRKTNSFIKH